MNAQTIFLMRLIIECDWAKSATSLKFAAVQIRPSLTTTAMQNARDCIGPYGEVTRLIISCNALDRTKNDETDDSELIVGLRERPEMAMLSNIIHEHTETNQDPIFAAALVLFLLFVLLLLEQPRDLAEASRNVAKTKSPSLDPDPPDEEVDKKVIGENEHKKQPK